MTLLLAYTNFLYAPYLPTSFLAVLDAVRVAPLPMAKRANDAAQEGETAAPALRLSPNYQSSSADVELVSKE